MPTYTDTASFSLRPNFKLEITVVSSGTNNQNLVMTAKAIRTGSETTTPFSTGAATRSYSFTNVNTTPSGSGSWVFDFGPAGSSSSSNPYEVWVYQSGINRTSNANSTVSVTASQSLMGTATATVTVPYISVSPPVIANSPTLASSATVGVFYQEYLFASNDPTSWSRSGSLPPGLTDFYSGSNYFVEGTPTTAGTYSFSVTATNAGGSDTNSYTITISAPPNPSWNSTGAFTSGKVNIGYYETRGTTNANSITGATTTAPGLTASASGTTLVLQGTPTVAGTYSVSATAVGASGTTSANLNTTVTIAPLVPPTWSDTSLADSFKVGQSYATTSSGNNSVSATNATAFSIVSGSLPAGITGTRSGSNYTLTGTPTTRGAYSFTLRASNSDGNATPDQTFSGTVTHPPLWTDETLAAFSQGRSYSDALTVSTSTAVTWSITSGSLPAGITATASGTNTNTYTLSGTPTGSGAYSFTVQASNSDGTLSKSFSGNILLVPNWIDNTLGNFVNGVEFSDSVSATNSPTYSVTAGSLPAGITLNSSTGLVSGTPIGAVGTAYSFTITATNSDGTISQAFSGTIQPDLGGGIKLFDGTTWDNKEIYVYDGSTWVLGRLYVYSGTAWIKSVY